MNLYVKTYRHSTSCITAKCQLGYLLLRNKVLITRMSILTILLTSTGLLVARAGSGQDVDEIMSPIDLKNVSLKQAFEKIESLTQLSFTYRTIDVADLERINFQATNTPVTPVLEDVLEPAGLPYRQVKR